MTTFEGKPGGPWTEINPPEPNPWQDVLDTTRRVWSLANDGLDHPGDDAEVKHQMAHLMALAERNGASV
jgi:hypothetical protein